MPPQISLEPAVSDIEAVQPDAGCHECGENALMAVEFEWLPTGYRWWVCYCGPCGAKAVKR